MAELFGLDVGQINRLADSVDQSAEAVERLADRARAGVTQSTAIWAGGDADQFRSLWVNGHDPTIRRAAAELRSMSERIRLNRDQQIEASAADLVAGGSTGQPAWTGAFVYGDRPDGRLVPDYGTGWGAGGAAAGSYHYRQLPGGGFVLEAEVDARYGTQGQGAGTFEGSIFGHDLTARGRGGAFVGARGEGSANLEFSDAGWFVDVNGEAFIGAEIYGDASMDYGIFSAAVDGRAAAGAYAQGEVTYHITDDGYLIALGADAGVSAEVGVAGDVALGEYVAVGAGGSAMVGVVASGHVMQEFDGRNFRTGADGEAFAGKKASVEGEVALLGGDVDMGGSVGVSAGVGAGFSGGFAFGADEIGYEIDLGLALGLGFDLSIEQSFDPSGLAGHIGDAGGAAVDVGKDATGWISPWW